MPPGMALIVTLRGSNYRCLEQIFMVLKGFEPSKFDCMLREKGILITYAGNEGPDQTVHLAQTVQGFRWPLAYRINGYF